MHAAAPSVAGTGRALSLVRGIPYGGGRGVRAGRPDHRTGPRWLPRDGRGRPERDPVPARERRRPRASRTSPPHARNLGEDGPARPSDLRATLHGGAEPRSAHGHLRRGDRGLRGESVGTRCAPCQLRPTLGPGPDGGSAWWSPWGGRGWTSSSPRSPTSSCPWPWPELPGWMVSAPIRWRSRCRSWSWG